MKPPARKTRAVVKSVQEVELPPLEKKPLTGDFFKDTVLDAEPDAESEHSDYGKTSRKRKGLPNNKVKYASPVKKKAKLTRATTPELPDLSDIESEDDHEDDVPLFEKRNRAAVPVKVIVTPKLLRLEIRSAPTTININLADLFPEKFSLSSSDNSTLVDEAEDFTSVAEKDSEGVIKMRLNPKYASFLELEPDLRNRIYRGALVAEPVVKFNPATKASREPNILQTCRQVYDEGRGILYGSNAFHFERVDRQRSRYWDSERVEIGYKDVRRFLETIGSRNIAQMRFLSLQLSDAVPGSTPKLEISERRYVNDPVLVHVLKMIGRSGVVLDKFVIGFTGRAELGNNDVLFIRALTSISCRSLIKTCVWGHSKVGAHLFFRMKEFMKALEGTEVNEKRQRIPKMQHNQSERQCYYCRAVEE